MKLNKLIGTINSAKEKEKIFEVLDSIREDIELAPDCEFSLATMAYTVNHAIDKLFLEFKDDVTYGDILYLIKMFSNLIITDRFITLCNVGLEKHSERNEVLIILQGLETNSETKILSKNNVIMNDVIKTILSKYTGSKSIPIIKTTINVDLQSKLWKTLDLDALGDEDWDELLIANWNMFPDELSEEMASYLWENRSCSFLVKKAVPLFQSYDQGIEKFDDYFRSLVSSETIEGYTEAEEIVSALIILAEYPIFDSEQTKEPLLIRKLTELNPKYETLEELEAIQMFDFLIEFDKELKNKHGNGLDNIDEIRPILNDTDTDLLEDYEEDPMYPLYFIYKQAKEQYLNSDPGKEDFMKTVDNLLKSGISS